MESSTHNVDMLLNASEDEHLEFKEAKNGFHFEELVKYCVALANEQGGTIVFGVTDKRPRRVVGTAAFDDLERTKFGLLERIKIRIEARIILHPQGRVVLFRVPPRPLGMPIQYGGAYWMRSGESLVPMTPDKIKQIFEETGPDFSAEVCRNATIADLDPLAIETFRTLWFKKAGLRSIQTAEHQQLLLDAELFVEDGVTYAALVLLGTRQALGKYLANSETIFEYRSNEASIPYQQRKEYRQGFLLYHDDIWDTINLRNDVHQYRERLFVWDIPTFNEDVVREAILNAVSHRDYRLGGSTFVKQLPRKLEIISPGSFPPGITAENILWKQSPRNRRIAEAMVKCGLVERSGQGANKMFEESIKESKPQPDFTGTDEYQVALTLRGEVQDPSFLSFLEKVEHDNHEAFTTQDFLLLDLIHRDQQIPQALRP